MDKVNNECFQDYINIINKSLDINISSKSDVRDAVIDAMKYALSAGGKRIRPILVLEFYKMCGGTKDIIDIACCIEMIHTFSLIHDDLPCMDDDDFRRGKPSCHIKYGEAIALLAGDALNTLPFEIIADNVQSGNIEQQTGIKLIKVLANSIGTSGMIGGQVIDIKSEGTVVSEQTLYQLQELKTGALIKCACEMGCILAEADDEKIQLAKEYAHYLGLAFQITDDVLDVIGDFKQLGKQTGADSKHNKSTFVTLKGLEESQELATELSREAIRILNQFDNNEFLISLTEYLLTRKN